MNFAPFSSPPSSPPASQTLLPRTSKPKTNWFSPSTYTSNSYQSGAPVASLDETHASSEGYSTQNYHDAEGGTLSGPEAYETRFGWRCDMEAAAAYVLGPVLAILLLIVETNNNYVRFHAWQSLLFCSGLGILHIALIWSRFLTRTLIAIDIISLVFLTYKGYMDGQDLFRLKLPLIGDLASSWVEEE